MNKYQIDQFVPGGIKKTDYVHRRTNDNTCSRCREEVPDDDGPLMLWDHSGENMLIYCEKCLGVEKMPQFENEL